MITLAQFVAKYPPGSRIDTDGFPPKQPYQCVDLTKQYMLDCYGIPLGAYGDAADYWTDTAPIILTKFDKVSTTSFIDGDMIIWGDDAGNFTGPAGHIAIWYQGQIYNQNYNGSGKVSFNKYFSAGFAGVLRPKETNVDKITKQQEQTCALMQTYSLPGKDYNYQFTGKPLTQDNLDKMLQFWSSQPRPQTPSGYKKVLTAGTDLYVEA